jgi:hypothetical protein
LVGHERTAYSRIRYCYSDINMLIIHVSLYILGVVAAAAADW